MATRRDETRARTEIANSERKRVLVGTKLVTASQRQKRAQLSRATHRSVHAPTKSLADAKAGKPGDGKKVPRWKTGPNGGEDPTTNGVEGTGRGADGPLSMAKTSRKSTRGSWAAGEKRAAQLQSRQELRVSSPEARAVRGK